MSAFEEAIRSHGLVPNRPVVPDGRVYRCGTQDKPRSTNGAYMLEVDGRFGWFQDWATDSEAVVWHADKGADEATPLVVDYDELRRRRSAERRAQQEAIRAARKFYRESSPLLGGHPYLESHGLDMTGCKGLRVDDEGWLVIPARRGKEIISLQRIAPDGQKRFWAGAPMSRVSYTIDRPGAVVTVLCEGLATGLAIFVAAPLVRVVVAFTAGNMAKIAETGTLAGMVAVAADNDHGTAERIGRNPGIEAAKDAARILGCGVMIPEGMQGTDWCDWRQEEMERRLSEQPRYGARASTPGSIIRSVDAVIATAVRNAARFIVPARRAS